MREVEWYRSGTFWSGIGLAAFGVADAATGDIFGGGRKVLEGVGLIFLRRGVGFKKGEKKVQ